MDIEYGIPGSRCDLENWGLKISKLSLLSISILAHQAQQLASIMDQDRQNVYIQ